MKIKTMMQSSHVKYYNKIELWPMSRMPTSLYSFNFFGPIVSLNAILVNKQKLHILHD